MPISVVFDSTAIHGQIRFDSATFRALERLVEAGEVRVLLPEVVYREAASQLAENQGAKLLESEHALRDARQLFLEARDTQEIDVAQAALARIEARRSDESAARPLDDWMRRLDVTTLPVKPEHFLSVLDGYFRGAPPFRKRRSRDDLPDALILESIRDAQAGHPNVRVVSGDKRLQEALATVLGAQTFPTLAAFFASDEVSTLIQAANAAANLARLGALLFERSGAPEVSRALVEALDHHEFESPSIPEDNQTATIQSVGQPTGVQLDVNEIEFLGDGSVLLPLTADCEVEVYYCIFKSEYYTMDDARSESISISDWNDHYFMATETLSATITATLSVELAGIDLGSAEMSPENLGQALDGASYSVDEIESVEIEDVPA